MAESRRMPGHTIEAAVFVPTADGEGLEEYQTSIRYVFDYGRALPRGIIEWRGGYWIVCRKADGEWHIEVDLLDIAKTRIHKFLKYRNYLRRVGLWGKLEELIGEPK